MPVLGSGPGPDNAGSGFYSVRDYRDILRAARDRGVEVLPELDTPGHARAAVMAMALRRRRRGEAGDLAVGWGGGWMA